LVRKDLKDVPEYLEKFLEFSEQSRKYAKCNIHYTITLKIIRYNKKLYMRYTALYNNFTQLYKNANFYQYLKCIKI